MSSEFSFVFANDADEANVLVNRLMNEIITRYQENKHFLDEIVDIYVYGRNIYLEYDNIVDLADYAEELRHRTFYTDEYKRLLTSSLFKFLHGITTDSQNVSSIYTEFNTLLSMIKQDMIHLCTSCGRNEFREIEKKFSDHMCFMYVLVAMFADTPDDDEIIIHRYISFIQITCSKMRNIVQLMNIHGLQ